MKFFSVILLVVALATIAIAEDAAKKKVEKVNDVVSKGAVDEKNAGEVAAPVGNGEAKDDEPIKNEDQVEEEKSPKDDVKEEETLAENDEDEEYNSVGNLIRIILRKVQDDLRKAREELRKLTGWGRR